MSLRPSTTCDIDRLRQYFEDELPDEFLAETEDHLAECSQCLQTLESFAGDAGWWSELQVCLRTHMSNSAVTRGEIASPHDEEIDDASFASDFVVEFLQPSDHPDVLGRLGEYEILDVIGQGGMGIVLKGFQPELGRFVAVKVMLPSLAASGTARQRFVREARAAAAIVHPHVMPIHSVSTASRLPYLVMPYLDCESLQQRIDRCGPLETIEVLRIGLQTAKALAAAHAMGLVHRDVKPANILLEKEVDRVILTDFGLARTVDDSSLTRTGVVTGTPQYMSPEQASGESIDARSDLFSLGSVMYSMCTGRAPFRAETILGVLRRIADRQPTSIGEINPSIPDWLQTIVARLHDKSAGGRYQTAAELAGLLEQCLAHLQQPMSNPLPAELARTQEPVESRLRQNGRRFANSAAQLVSVGCVLVLVLTLMAIMNRAPEKAVNATPRPAPEIMENINAPRAVSKRPPDPAPFDDKSLNDSMEWDFQGSRPGFLLEWGSHRIGREEQLPDGLKIVREPTSDDSEFAVGFEIDGEFAGNFEITLDYRDFKSQTTRTDWRIPRVDISGQVFSADEPHRQLHVLGIAHRRDIDASQRITAMQGDSNSSEQLNWRSWSVAADRDDGRLRLVRQGTSMFYQTASKGSEDWITISCRSIDDGTFKLVVLGLRAEDLEGRGEVVLTRIMIRAMHFKSN